MVHGPHGSSIRKLGNSCSEQGSHGVIMVHGRAWAMQHAERLIGPAVTSWHCAVHVMLLCPQAPDNIASGALHRARFSP